MNTPTLIFIAAPVNSAQPTEQDMKTSALAALNVLRDETQESINELTDRQNAVNKAIDKLRDSL